MIPQKLFFVLCTAAGLSLSSAGHAQTAPKPAATTEPDRTDEPVKLSPFTVSTDKDKGYRATNSISGSRLDTAIKDMPMPIEVITEQFLRDTGSKDLRQSLRYSAGIQLQSQNDYGTPGGAYQGPGGVNNPEGATANQSQTSVKIRGFVTESVLRDGYLRQNSTDSINIGRVEVVRGPAALLYGVGNFGGIVNYLPKLPEAKQQGTVGLSLGSYSLKRATLDTTGPISKTWDFNYRFTGAWEDAGDYTQYRKSSHHFLSPVVTFKPTPTTDVIVDYENGTAKDKGIGFQRVRSSVGPGPNNDQNEHAAFYTIPGTSPRTFRWSGPDTHLDTDSSNLRVQVTQRLVENLTLLVGYNKSKVTFNKLDVIGNLQGWTDQFTNPDPAFGNVLYTPADPVAGDSNTGLGNLTGLTRATLAYRWTGEATRNDRDQVRAELLYKFKLLDGQANQWLRLDNMIMLGHTELKFQNDKTTYQTAWNQNNDFSWVTNYYNPTNANPLRFGQKQPNGTAELPYLKNTGAQATTWNQANYVVYQGKLLGDRLTLVSGARRDRNETATTNVTYLGTGAPTSARRPADSQTTYQNGASFQVTREISLYALKSGGLQPNFTGNRDTNGNPLPATLAKSQEAGLKIDLFEGKLTGTVNPLKIKRTDSPIFYWRAPTSNYSSRFNPNKDIVYQVNDFRPSSLGGPSGNNNAGQASLAQWNAAVAAGTIYQSGANWYANASKATGAAFLDAVFDFTKANKFSWPGWLYNVDANTNNTFDTRASGPDGNEYVLGADSSKGWDTQLMFTPNDNLQIVLGYAHVNRVVDSAGQFSKSPYPQDRWAVWNFPNTDWGLTSTSLAKAYAVAGDSSSWTGTNWGAGLPMDDTPEHQFTAWSNYAFTKGVLKGLTIGAGGSHESPRLYLSGLTHGGGQQITDKNGNSIMLRTRSRLSADLMVRYKFKLGDRDTSVQLNVNNVLNDQKLYGLIYSAPTTARLECLYSF